jgi:hypothetical protein
VLYFGVLLIHRERRDDAKCSKKYGENWKRYKWAVRWRILPWISSRMAHSGPYEEAERLLLVETPRLFIYVLDCLKYD